MNKVWHFIESNWKHFFWGAIAIACTIILAVSGDKNWLVILPTIAIAAFTSLYWKEAKLQAKETRDLARMQFISTFTHLFLEEDKLNAEGRSTEKTEYFFKAVRDLFCKMFPEKDDEKNRLVVEIMMQEKKENGVS